MKQLKNCVITGGGSGLGKELALIYSQKGYHVHIIGRYAEKLAAVKQEIESTEGLASVYQLDLRNPAEIERLAQHFQTSAKKVEFLINNAGIGIFGPFEEIDPDDLETTFETNVYAPIMMTKAFLPLMSENGRVINIISTAGLRGKKNEAIYSASKFALRGFTQSMQQEFADSSIKFVAAYMGGMNTPFWEHSTHITDASRLKKAAEVAQKIVVEAAEKTEIMIESN
ncbi:SDR family NAD(P)-dependent oxidoreductase [Bacillus sp. FJAT-42315]|uniref:SDR family NAD(P)-dependent oxidoreductase n=1 Tax=Bacillus sp. FJAT-42315 TaxID=2014077 RepID=UPI003FA49FE3